MKQLIKNPLKCRHYMKYNLQNNMKKVYKFKNKLQTM